MPAKKFLRHDIEEGPSGEILLVGYDAKGVKSPIKKMIRSRCSLPSSEALRFTDYFEHGWDWLQKREDNSWITRKDTPIEKDGIWKKHQDKDQLLALRFGNDTRIAVIDVDKHSEYHPDYSDNGIELIETALERIGINTTVKVQSSFSGGIHLLIPLPHKVSTFSLACALSVTLHSHGLKEACGVLEIFPNVKRYATPGQISLYKGIRLPLQPNSGSFLLKSDFTIKSDSVRELLAEMDKAAEEQDMGLLEQLLPHAKNVHKKYVRKLTGRKKKEDGEEAPAPTSYSDRALVWKQALEEVLITGWTGKSQSNNIFIKLVAYLIVFKRLEGETLLQEAARIVENTPGFWEHSKHTKDYKKRLGEVYYHTRKNNYYVAYGKEVTRETNPPEISSEELRGAILKEIERENEKRFTWMTPEDWQDEAIKISKISPDRARFTKQEQKVIREEVAKLQAEHGVIRLNSPLGLKAVEDIWRKATEGQEEEPLRIILKKINSIGRKLTDYKVAQLRYHRALGILQDIAKDRTLSKDDLQLLQELQEKYEHQRQKNIERMLGFKAKWQARQEASTCSGVVKNEDFTCQQTEVVSEAAPALASSGSDSDACSSSVSRLCVPEPVPAQSPSPSSPAPGSVLSLRSATLSLVGLAGALGVFCSSLLCSAPAFAFAPTSPPSPPVAVPAAAAAAAAGSFTSLSELGSLFCPPSLSPSSSSSFTCPVVSPSGKLEVPRLRLSYSSQGGAAVVPLSLPAYSDWDWVSISLAHFGIPTLSENPRLARHLAKFPVKNVLAALNFMSLLTYRITTPARFLCHLLKSKFSKKKIHQAAVDHWARQLSVPDNTSQAKGFFMNAAFKSWYRAATVARLIKDIPMSSLPLYYNLEPIVFLDLSRYDGFPDYVPMFWKEARALSSALLWATESKLNSLLKKLRAALSQQPNFF